MGLFDFLKSKSNDPLSSIHNNPSVRKMMIAAEVEALSATMSNLKSVGREAEAEKRAKEYLIALSSDCVSKYSDSSEALNALATSSIILGQAQLGKRLLEKILEFHVEVTSANVKGAPALDLTQAYIDSGRLAHQIRESRDDEYRCYWAATEAVPPPGCKFPATKRQKAIAHEFAFRLCLTESHKVSNEHINWAERAVWHDAKRREFAPECAWDNFEAVIAWMSDHSSFVSKQLPETRDTRLEKGPVIQRPILPLPNVPEPPGGAIQLVNQYKQLKANLHVREAKNLLTPYFLDLFETWREDPRDFRHLRVITRASIYFTAYKDGFDLINAAIKQNSECAASCDLTGIYLDLGILAYYQNLPVEEIFDLFASAVNVASPLEASCSASAQLKAAACKFASLFAPFVFDPAKAARMEYLYRSIATDYAPEIEWTDSESLGACSLRD